MSAITFMTGLMLGGLISCCFIALFSAGKDIDEKGDIDNSGEVQDSTVLRS